MHRRITLLATALALTVVACGVVEDGKVERIDPQFGLDDTLPSTTSPTTTTLPLQTTTSGVEPTTTVPEVQVEQVQLYFVDSGRLRPVFQPLAFPASLPQVIFALQQGPPPDQGLRTILPGTEVQILVSANGTGVASVTLPDDFFDSIEGNEQRLVSAQLVLTLTNRPGVGQVTFNIPVLLPNGGVRIAGQPLTFSDYATYMSATPQEGSEVSVPAATTTSTTEG